MVKYIFACKLVFIAVFERYCTDVALRKLNYDRAFTNAENINFFLRFVFTF